MSAENSLIKKPYSSESYTVEQLQEFARCADPVHGPRHFMSNYFYIQHPIKGRMNYVPFEYQDRLIETYHNYRFSISLMPRQTGKTTSAAGYLLWYAMFNPDSTILIAAHKYTGAQEIMQRIRYAYELCPDFIRAGCTSYNKGSIEFENGSRIVSQTTTETTGRGMSITLLYCDEFAFVRPTIATEFWTSISPTLSTGGKAIITSTPNSDEDQFALIWKGSQKCIDEFGNKTELGVNGFKGYQASWWEHPDRDDKWKSEEMGRIGEDRFRREHGCEFLIFDETLINASALLEMQGTDPIEKQGQVRWYHRPKRGSTYVVALDPSLGTGGDAAAIQVVELPACRQVAEWQHNKTDIRGQIRVLKEICNYLYEEIGTQNDIYYSVENNTLGEAALIAISEIGEENIRGSFASETRGSQPRRYRRGFTTTNKSKLAACAKLKSLIESKKMVISSSNLISELKNFVAHGSSFEAKTGETDDLVMSMILVIRVIQYLQSFDPTLDSYVKDHDEFIEPMPFILM
jgi:Terminase large subunit, T4likevirus-type, N-terminal/Terminase RNaseH-like domain